MRIYPLEAKINFEKLLKSNCSIKTVHNFNIQHAIIKNYKSLKYIKK